MYIDMFINMRQACGHWKIGKNTYLLQNDHFQCLKNYRERVLSIYKC